MPSSTAAGNNGLDHVGTQDPTSLLPDRTGAPDAGTAAAAASAPIYATDRRSQTMNLSVDPDQTPTTPSRSRPGAGTLTTTNTPPNSKSNNPTTNNTTPNRWASIRTTFTGFWGEGRRTDDTSIDYLGIHLTIGRDVYDIELGDAVMMRAEDGATSDEDRRSPDGKKPGNSRREPESRQQQQQQQQELPRSEVGNSNGNDDSGNDNNGNMLASSSNTADYVADATSAEATADYYGDEEAEEENGINNNTTDQVGNTLGGGSPSPSFLLPTIATKEAKIGDGLMLARVERIWQETGRGGRSGRVMFSSRWFLKKDDVDALPLNGITGPEDFAKRITEHDLVLSNQSDDNHVTTICGPIQVLYRQPDSDGELPVHILPTTYVCRYSLSIGDVDTDEDRPDICVLPFEGEDDDWGMMTLAAVTPPAKRNGSTDHHHNNEDGGGGGGGDDHYHDYYDGNGNELDGSERRSLHPMDDKTGRGVSGGRRRRVDSYGSEDDISFGDDGQRTKKKLRVNDVPDEGINEGTTEQRDIRVGREHQVYVPPYVPNQRSVSRNPTCVWQVGMIDQGGVDNYIQEAANILTPYLRDHRWTQEEPYTPFPTTRMEELNRTVNWSRLPTLSSVSTASSLTSSERRVDALREFDVDALLWNLSASNYDIKAALGAIEASPRDYLTVWSPRERALFNNGFRRYAGSLRAIYKHMGNKDLEEVIDYHYRFKIPDQYRRSQDRKREQAIRMLECIETKRNLNAPILMPISLRQDLGTNDENTKNGDWSRTGISDVATSLEERRVKAKELLLDVQSQLGKNKMVEVFNAIKDHQSHSSTLQSKAKLLEILRGNKEFQSRFLEFLPQELRL